MAELNVKVVVKREDFDTFRKDITKLKNEVKEIVIDVTSVKKAINEVKGLEKAQAGLITSYTKLEREVSKQKTAEAKYSAELQKTAREQEKTAQTANRRAQAEATAHAKIVAAEQKTQQALLKTESAVSRTTSAWQKMFSVFSASTIISSGITRAISAMRTYFNEALQEMKALDLAATHYTQVMGDKTTPEQTKALTNQAYSTASRYGTSASDYMEAVATYARAGYKDVADQLAELSMKTVIVGQTTQEVADQFLLTMDTAYKYEGSVKELTKVLDGASAIDSNYATTIEKIATGLGLVAPLAQQVHTSEAELTAAIGTITAATQRSGAEAARALRSLFLNIIKDTTTEIEDGVTATEESVASVQYLLEKYASSAVEAARASGQVIDPMEAIGALAQSMQDGLLKETELMDLLSGIGGKLRISQLVALISNWDMYNEMIETYEGAMGSANQKTDAYLESWEAKVNILKNTWVEFVAKTADTDLFKGILDGSAKVLKAIGNLKNGIVMVGSAIAAIKLTTMASGFAKVSESASDLAMAMHHESVALLEAGKYSDSLGKSYSALQQEQVAASASTKSLISGLLGVASVIATVIQVVEAYQRAQVQSAIDEANRLKETATLHQQEADKVQELYNVYYNAKKAYEDNTITLEQYEIAVRNLATALGIEKGAIDEVTGAIEQNTAATAHEAIKASRGVIAQLENAALKQATNKSILVGDNVAKARFDEKSKLPIADEREAIDRMKQAYQEYIKVRDDALADGIITKEEQKGYDEAIKIIDRYKDTLGQIGEQEDIIRKNIDFLEALGRGEFDEMSVEELKEELEGVADGSEDAAEGVEEATEKFYGLAKAVHEAEQALEEYEKQTQKEKDSDYKKYADAWKKAFEDIQKGFVNSNAVNAALDLFFTPEQIMKMREKGINAADVLANDFWQEIFTYTDENGNLQFVSGEDAGANLAWKLFGDFADEAGNIVDANGKIVASFEEVNGALNIDIEDLEALSEAMSAMYGIDMDPEFLAVWFEALGMYSQDYRETADSIKEIAESYEALNSKGQIDLTKLISGELASGKTTEEVADLLDYILQLEQQGEIEIKGNFKNHDQIVEQCKELIKKKDEIGKEPAEVKVEADTEEANEKLSAIEKKQIAIDEMQPEFHILAVDEATGKIKIIHEELDKLPETKEIAIYVKKDSQVADRLASGTKSASGGLTLVNEEGAELIVEGNHARIAGNGNPTLTMLGSGATVYTARETRAILGGSNYSGLFDGINAYENGFPGGHATGIRQWTPPSSGGNDNGGSNISDNEGGNYGSGSGSASTSGTGSDKDEQLEALKARIELLKSELSLMKERGDSLNKQNAKQRQIQKAYQDEIDYLKSIGGDQKEINDLSTQWWKIENDINDALEKREKEKEEKEKKRQEHTIDWYEKKTDLAKAELSLLEAQDAPVKKQIEKQKEISNWIRKEINYLKKIGGHQEDILKLEKERKDIEKDIADLNKGLLDDLATAINAKIDKLNEKRDKEVEKVQKQIDALQAQKEVQDNLNEGEEKRLALLEAEENLLNAQTERTVRQYNAKTGQWEWVADANAIKNAQESYDSASKALADYNAEQEFAKQIEALEAKQEKITEKYAKKTDQWQKVLESMEEPVITIAQALKNIEKNASKDMSDEIKSLNKLLKPLGYQIGGKKKSKVSWATGVQDAESLSADLVATLLQPVQAETLEQRMSVLRGIYGGQAGLLSAISNSSIGSQHNGDVYSFGNITLSETQARQTTLYDFVQASKGLRAYNGTM